MDLKYFDTNVNAENAPGDQMAINPSSWELMGHLLSLKGL